jgi:TolB-like protein/tetratricopeptide (TPR) repeat protein
MSWRVRPRDAAVGALSGIRSVAVLPLNNFSGDREQEYFADGMTDAVIARLSALSGLRVVSRTSVMQFKNTGRPIPEVARALGVDAVVEGSVVRAQGRVRVNAKVIRADTDTALWSGTYERPVQDVLALQSEVAQAIAGQVVVTLSGEERKRLLAARPVAPEVYESYLKGRFAGSRATREAVESALRHFDEAIERDPTFAPAWAAKAEAYNRLGTILVGGAPPSETQPKALAAAHRVLELNPDSAEGHRLVGYVLQRRWRWAEAEASFRRALELDPNDADGLTGLSDLLASLGRFDEAIALARRGRDLDPLTSLRSSHLGLVLYYARRYDDAVREMQSMLTVFPGDPTGTWYLALSLTELNRSDEAAGALERTLAVSRVQGLLGTLANAYARSGRRADAERVLGDLQREADSRYVNPAVFVSAYVGLGDRDRAFAALERAYQERSNMIRILKVEPTLDPLRTDPRYADLMRRVGLN